MTDAPTPARDGIDEGGVARDPRDERSIKTGVPQMVLRDASALRDNPRNTRTHSDAQVADMARILVEFGFTSPVLVDGPDCLDIVAGHGRKLGALRAWADGAQLHFPGGAVIPQGQVPTLDVNGWSPEQRRAYVIADNAVALQAGWDDDLLASELADLGNANFDLGLLGFGDDLEAMMATPTPPEPSRAGNMAAEFLVPPFSVLNAREGWWQDRKRSWLALGIKSELGRGQGDDPATPGGAGGGMGKFQAAGNGGMVEAATRGRSMVEPPEPAPPLPGDDGLTVVSPFVGGWWAKREDGACYTGPDMPSGAKVRQFAAMAAAAPEGAQFVVGCSAESAMQVYIAAAGKLSGLPAVVFCPRRKVTSGATAYAKAMGADVREIGPGGYLSTCRARARDYGKTLPAVVKWNPALATADTADQCANLPADIKRVVVPPG